MSLILHQQDIDCFREFVARRFGLNLENGNCDRLVEALQRGLDRTGCVEARSYVQHLDRRACSKSEIDALVADLTVAETYFFRHPDQFRATLERAIVERLRSEQPGRRLRMLSAGCAGGEEAYSLAILARDNVPEDASWSVEVLGIDLNAHLLEKAARARYTSWSLRGVPEDVQERHFRKTGGEFVLQDSVRELVTFAECNLVDEDPSFWQPDAFDVIFCRNVTMYFTLEAGRSVIARLARSLAPGGFLFMGPAETLRGISQDFHLQHTHETFYYQRRLAGEEAPRCDEDYKPAVQKTNQPLTLTTDVDQSWVRTICSASDRVASLSRDALQARPAYRTPANDVSGNCSDASTTLRLRAARQFALEERFDEALRVLQALPGIDGHSPDAQLLCAAVLTNSGRVREAEQLCRKVLGADEFNAEAHYLLALCREHGGEVAAAIEQDQMAIYLDPQFAMPHLHLALLVKRAGNRDAASQAFRRAADLLAREDASRIALFGGGFDREALAQVCYTEIRSSGGLP